MNNKKILISIVVLFFVLLTFVGVYMYRANDKLAEVDTILGVQSGLDFAELFEPYDEIPEEKPRIEFAEDFNGDTAKIQDLANTITDITGIDTSVSVTSTGERSQVDDGVGGSIEVLSEFE